MGDWIKKVISFTVLSLVFHSFLNSQVTLIISAPADELVLVFPPYSFFPNKHSPDTLFFDVFPEQTYSFRLNRENCEVLLRMNGMGYSLFAANGDTIQIHLTHRNTDIDCGIEFSGENAEYHNFYNCSYKLFKSDFRSNIDKLFNPILAIPIDTLITALVSEIQRIEKMVDDLEFTDQNQPDIVSLVKNTIRLDILQAARFQYKQLSKTDSDFFLSIKGLPDSIYSIYPFKVEEVGRTTNAGIEIMSYLSHFGYFDEQTEDLTRDEYYPKFIVPEEYFSNFELVEEFLMANILLDIRHIFQSNQCRRYKRFIQEFPTSEYLKHLSIEDFCSK